MGKGILPAHCLQPRKHLFPGSPETLQILGLPSLHNHVSQFLKVNQSLLLFHSLSPPLSLSLSLQDVCPTHTHTLFLFFFRTLTNKPTIGRMKQKRKERWQTSPSSSSQFHSSWDLHAFLPLNSVEFLTIKIVLINFKFAFWKIYHNTILFKQQQWFFKCLLWLKDPKFLPLHL